MALETVENIKYAINILEGFALRADDYGNCDSCDAYSRAADILRYVLEGNNKMLDLQKEALGIYYESVNI